MMISVDARFRTRSAATAVDLVISFVQFLSIAAIASWSKRLMERCSLEGDMLLAGAGRAARRFIFAAQNIFDIFLQRTFNN